MRNKLIELVTQYAEYLHVETLGQLLYMVYRDHCLGYNQSVHEHELYSHVVHLYHLRVLI